MQTTMQTLGYDNVFIGTVEGKPEETACENVIEAVKAAGYTKVILRPLMVVAGDHANNDMAGEDADSWLSQFKASGAFDSIDCQIAGLGDRGCPEPVCRPHQGGDRFSERLIKRTLSVSRPLCGIRWRGFIFYLNNGIIKADFL